MKWIKSGRIFNPEGKNIFNKCNEFAQSPQVLLFDDFIRIYFSTREQDSKGTYLSHIGFVDVDRNFRSVLRISERPVLPLGGLGTFDEHGIFPINPIRVKDEVWAFTCGWSRRYSVSVETSTGLVKSLDNGLTFTRSDAGPVLSNSLHEPFLVGDSFVRQFSGVFHMWYIFGVRWIENEKEGPARVYKIAHATSNDGINWSRNSRQIIEDVIDENECQALPSVAYFGGRFHMVFCYRNAFGFRTDPSKGYRLGYALSEDGIHWERNDSFGNVDQPHGVWDSKMRCYPHLEIVDGRLHLLYNGNEFGRYGFGHAVLEER